jgi:hypothetical protein
VRGPTAKEIAAAARVELKRHRDQLLADADRLEALIRSPNLRLLDADLLRQQRDELLVVAARATDQLKSREWFYFGLLRQARAAGVDLGYTSPVRREPEINAQLAAALGHVPTSQNKPHGPGIDYLTAAAAGHGYSISPDRARKLIDAFNNLPFVGATLGAKVELRAHAVFLRKGQLSDE